MSELESQLLLLAPEVAWPPTPQLALHLESDLHQRRLRLPPGWVAIAAALIAIAIALSVPAARSAILRALHLGGVTIERVQVLPTAQERPLAAGLGPVVDARRAAELLGSPMGLPPLNGTPRPHLRDGVVSVLLSVPQALLLSEFRANEFVLKKIAGSATDVVSLEVGGSPGLWIAGAHHVVFFPASSPRLAGNVLVWQQDGLVYRLEGHHLTRRTALEVATEIEGT